MTTAQIFELDGSQIHSYEDFENAFSALGFVPGWYGRNLNALWDVLTGCIERPVKLVWLAAGHSRVALGADFERIVEVMREAQTKTQQYAEAFEPELRD